MINFILGLIIGGLIVMIFMCILQINRINEMQNKINEVKRYINNLLKSDYKLDVYAVLVTFREILGGDVDDE